jgi:hypothetical protein
MKMAIVNGLPLNRNEIVLQTIYNNSIININRRMLNTGRYLGQGFEE